MKKLKCDVCGARFAPAPNLIEVVSESNGLAEIFGPKAYYDAIDCTHCGRQKLLGVRMLVCQDDEPEEDDI